VNELQDNLKAQLIWNSLDHIRFSTKTHVEICGSRGEEGRNVPSPSHVSHAAGHAQGFVT
jgi:hypothetical protein